jgi:hypothetical protein
MTEIQTKTEDRNLVRDIYLKFFIGVVIALGLFEIVALLANLDYYTIQDKAIALLVTTILYGLVTLGIIGKKHSKDIVFKLSSAVVVLIGFILTVLRILRVFRNGFLDYEDGYGYGISTSSLIISFGVHLFFVCTIGIAILLLFLVSTIKSRNYVAHISKIVALVFIVLSFFLITFSVVSGLNFSSVYFRVTASSSIIAATAIIVALLGNLLKPSEVFVPVPIQLTLHDFILGISTGIVLNSKNELNLDTANIEKLLNNFKYFQFEANKSRIVPSFTLPSSPEQFINNPEVKVALDQLINELVLTSSADDKFSINIPVPTDAINSIPGDEKLYKVLASTLI